MSAPPEQPTRTADGDFTRLSAAGDHAKGEFSCCDCGYGLAVYRELPACPNCGGSSWQTASWRPLGRALETSAAQSPNSLWT